MTEKKITFNGKLPIEALLDLKGVTATEALGESKEAKSAKADRINCTTNYLMSQEPSFLTGLLGMFDNYIWYAQKTHNKPLLKSFKIMSKLISNRSKMYKKNYTRAVDKLSH